MNMSNWMTLLGSLFMGFVIGFVIRGTITNPPPLRRAVYEIPMAKGASWRVTTFRDKVYVLIEAPSMPEEIIK